MLIEMATARDLDEILALQRLAFQGEAERYNDHTLPPLTQTLEQLRVDFERQTLLKASTDGIIVGSVRGHAENGTCHVGRLVVHPDYQKRGIATRLMAEIEEAFAGAERFELFTGDRSEPALRLYDKLGYVEFERRALDTHTLVFLEKHCPWNTAQSMSRRDALNDERGALEVEEWGSRVLPTDPHTRTIQGG